MTCAKCGRPVVEREDGSGTGYRHQEADLDAYHSVEERWIEFEE